MDLLRMVPGAATDAIALSAEHVIKRYANVVALNDVSVAIPRGASLALIGESGSGKTTLLRTFNRLVDPDAGTVRVDGVDVASVDPVRLRRRIGYVPQDGGLLPHWRVQRNVELVLRLNGVSDAADRARATLTLVGLDPDRFAGAWPTQLSGGQRQRVAIARALAAEPALLLLDEPFGALDAITRAELQDAFAAIRARLAMTTAMVTHDLHEALLLATHVAVMRAGKIEQFATPDALVAVPATAYVERLLRRARVSATA
ncbi:MAG TPA: ATP-binding cassette domain-containing protein [Gemmatimonadaceae bacterium]|nr:ATP-binding cassette domain-containing protein [Gemmatimonadaceae bacterium]